MYSIYEEKGMIPADVIMMNLVLKDKASAEEYLSMVNKKVAVAYYDEVADSEDVTAAIEAVRSAEERVAKYVDEKSVRKFQAKNISCRFCGSSIAKDYLKDDICPVCGHDLRIQNIIDGENQLKQKVEDAKAQLDIQRDINRIKNGKKLWMSNAGMEEPEEECVVVPAEE